MIGMHKFRRDVDHKLRVLQHADMIGDVDKALRVGAVLQPLPVSRCIQRKSTLRGSPRTAIIQGRMSHKCADIT
jgi:hypothetical protein